MHGFAADECVVSARVFVIIFKYNILPYIPGAIWHLSFPTAQCEQIGMSHHHESCSKRFLLLHGWVGCKGSLY
jgi:hypothetical protein